MQGESKKTNQTNVSSCFFNKNPETLLSELKEMSELLIDGLD